MGGCCSHRYQNRNRNRVQVSNNLTEVEFYERLKIEAQLFSDYNMAIEYTKTYNGKRYDQFIWKRIYSCQNF